MKNKILTAFSLRDELASEVIRAIGEEFREVEIDSAWSANSVMQKINNGERFQVLIVSINIPDDRGVSDMNEDQGLRLLQSLDKIKLNMPSILIVPSKTDDLLLTTQEFYSKCYVLDLSRPEDWKKKLIDHVANALSYHSQNRETDDRIKCVDVDISATAENDQMVLWDVEFKVDSKDPIYVKPVTIAVESKTIKKLMDWSKKLKKEVDKNSESCESTLRDIGEELIDLFSSNFKFNKQFYTLADVKSGIEKFRFRFKVKRSAHPLILEALAETRDNKTEYWMLKAPIYRSVWTGKAIDFYIPPLFYGDEGPYRCLVIKSDIGKNYVPCVERQFEELDNIDDEVTFLGEFLKNQNGFSVVTIPEKDEICTDQYVKDWLVKKGPWHMVHYAGHSYYGRYKKDVSMKNSWTDNDSGLLFFPDKKEVKGVPCDCVSEWLRTAQTRFVYLSSCRSSEEDFLYELADCGIPSALGFRWDIDDNNAIEHTKVFYNKLVERRSLEYAFLDTRKLMKEKKNSDNKIFWAAPVLMMQFPSDIR